MIKRTFAASLILILTALLTACPSEDDLTRMAKASRELAHDTSTGTKAVKAYYESVPLTPERMARKDRIAEKLKLIATNGKRFNDLLIEIDKKYPEGTEPPPETLRFLRENWQEVIVPFRELYQDLKTDGAESKVKDLKKNTDKITEVLNK